VLPGKLDMSLGVSTEELNSFLRALLKSNDDHFTFYYKNYELQSSLKELLIEFSSKAITSEETIVLNYVPESLFQVRPVTRISSSLEGHEEAVLDIAFSPDNRFLASCSGDKTIRLWEPTTETPIVTLQGHQGWVMTLAWSPDTSRLVSADVSGILHVWEINKIKDNLDAFLDIQKKQKSEAKGYMRRMIGHNKFITSLSWKPAHLDGGCEFLASSSKDGTIRIWDTTSGQSLVVGARHMKSVTKVVWSGDDLLYSASQDCQIFVWDSKGMFLRKLQPHAHWVNCLSLSTFHAIRSGFVNYSDFVNDRQIVGLSKEEKQSRALETYQAALKTTGKEYLASGSDDNTVMLFVPKESDKPLKRLAGHTAPINHIQFAPSGVIFVSASFDNTLRIWSIFADTCLGVLRGHVSDVYMLAFSRDSKWIVSGSKDSTIQIWSVKEKKRAYQLPGHADEVYAVDWSPDGLRMASAGKDKMVRIWKN
jgi:ribosome assembly protein 4